jgi:hypothetical protein
MNCEDKILLQNYAKSGFEVSFDNQFKSSLGIKRSEI